MGTRSDRVDRLLRILLTAILVYGVSMYADRDGGPRALRGAAARACVPLLFLPG